MKAIILKKAANAVPFLILFFLASCAQDMESTNMGKTMQSMEDKKMIEMQDTEKMDSEETMNDMKDKKSMDESSDKKMGSMDKMMK